MQLSGGPGLGEFSEVTRKLLEYFQSNGNNGCKATQLARVLGVSTKETNQELSGGLQKMLFTRDYSDGETKWCLTPQWYSPPPQPAPEYADTTLQSGTGTGPPASGTLGLSCCAFPSKHYD